MPVFLSADVLPRSRVSPDNETLSVSLYSSTRTDCSVIMAGIFLECFNKRRHNERMVLLVQATLEYKFVASLKLRVADV